MIESGNFTSTNTTNPTNESIVVAFSPAQNTINYTYIVYKDNKQIDTVTINNNQNTDIYLDETGTYQIVVTLNNQDGVQTLTSPSYLIDKEAPTINNTKATINLYRYQKFDPLAGISATDNRDGNITNKITTNINEINLNEKGTKTLTYTVTDNAGNKTTKDVTLNVGGSYFNLITLWIIIIIGVIFFISFIKKMIRALKLEKRIEPYTLEPKNSKISSITDNILLVYRDFIQDLASLLSKSQILNKYADKLNKFAITGSIHKTGMEMLAGKIVISIAFVIGTVFSRVIQFKLMNNYDLLLPFIIGFFILDIIYIIKYKFYKSKIENDLLSAVTVMNNAFKSGRSIIQAIEIASKEIKGPVGQEFAKMNLELSYGLDIEEVFKRFSKRINLDEVNYLTASLAVLNKTGGNIVEVFNSIEKSMFNKKKLRIELKSLTGSSKIIIYVLLSVPFIFAICINLISPGYFDPFIKTKIGLILLCIMIIYYIIFVICVRKIMKVVI